MTEQNKKNKSILFSLLVATFLIYVIANMFFYVKTNEIDDLEVGGVDGSIQYNNNNVLDGNENFIYNKENRELFLNGFNTNVSFKEISLFNGSYKLPVVNATDSLGNQGLAVYDKIFSFDSGIGTGGAQIFLWQPEVSDTAIIDLNNDILRITGTQDLTHITNPASIYSLSVGTNSIIGLLPGDINASTIYYDTLVAKSPIVMCSQGDNKCLVIDLEAEKEFYVTIDDEYNIISSKNKDDKKKEAVTEKISKKFAKINCELDNTSIYVKGSCLVNPYLVCEKSLDSIWNFKTNSCEYNPEKECRSNGNLWTGSQCTIKEVKPPTLEQLKQKCLNNKENIFYNGSCITLEEYYVI